MEQFDDLAIITPSAQQINLTHRVYASLVCGSAGPCLEPVASQWHKSEKLFLNAVVEKGSQKEPEGPTSLASHCVQPLGTDQEIFVWGGKFIQMRAAIGNHTF